MVVDKKVGIAENVRDKTNNNKNKKESPQTKQKGKEEYNIEIGRKVRIGR